MVTLALILPGLLGYAIAAPSVVLSPAAFVVDGVDGFEELDGPKGITVATIGSSTYALVSAYDDDGVQIIDITDPFDPSPVAAMTDGEGGFELAGARHITTAAIGPSTYAFVSSSDGGVQIIDITTPSSPTPAAFMSSALGTTFYDPRDLVTFAIGPSTYALVAGNTIDIQIINITDPFNPNFVTAANHHAGIDFFDGVRGLDTAVIGSSTYALVAEHGGDAFRIINITDPSHPSPVATVHDSQDVKLDGATAVTAVTIGSSTYALVAAQSDNAIQIINITDPSHPSPVAFAQDGIGGFDRLDYPEGITTATIGSSTYAFVAAFLDGIQIIDITDPSDPIPAASVVNFDPRFGNFALPEDIAVATIDSKIYVVAASYFSDGVPIINVTFVSGPLLTSASLDEGTGILRVEFSSAVDVTPASMVDLSGLVIRDSGQSVTLTGATLNTVADSAVISIEMTEDQRRLVAALASPLLDISGAAVTDTSGNPIESTSGNAITVYNTNEVPTAASIERSSPAAEITSERSLVFEVTFSENVTGVDLADFVLSPDSTMEPTRFTQTRDVSLPIPDRGAAISDTIAVADSGDISSVSIGVDITHTKIGNLRVDLLAPDGTVVNLHKRTGGNSDNINQTYEPAFDGAGLAGDWVLRVRDMTDQDIGTLNGWTLTIEYEENIDAVVGLTGSGSQYLVSVLALRDGTYNLDIVSDSGIVDMAGSPLNGTEPAGSDHSYVVETGPPEVVSIERSGQIIHPTGYQSLVFGVNFSEPVRGVDAADFVLSPDDGRALGNFTQTMTPSLPIPDNSAAVFDAVAIDSSGAVRSVSVDVDISHTYISDLSVALIAPDGTIALLHDRAGGSLSDINQTYAPNLAGISLNGNWTLRMNDAGPADTGTLNEWTLSIEYDEADNTLTGSGSRYLVTVPAAQNGTYNLDVVPNSGISDLAGNPLSGDDPPVDQSFQVAITNLAPVTVDAGSDQAVMGGQTVALNGTATAINGDPLTYSWTHDSALAIQFANSTSPSTTFTAPLVSSNTTLTLTLTAGDGTATASDSVNILIIPTQNTHPVLDAIPEQAVDEMSTLAFVASATDEDRPPDTLTYGLEDPPTGASIDPATGAFTWRPAEDQNGIHTVTVTVSDGHGGIDSQDVQVTVNEVNMPPALDVIPAQTIDELAMLTFTVIASDDDRHPGVGTEVVARKLNIPWSIDWTPDWTALFTERGGDLRIIQDGILLPDPIFSVDVDDEAEGGLLGIAVDPDFEENHYIYLYQTYESDGATLNKVVRYTLANMTVSEDLVLIDGIPGAPYHDGGRIQFGPDGNLYITTGDAGRPPLAQDLGSLAGKILRLTRDGTIPQDNPFDNSAVWSWGHRNPQGMDWDGSGNLIATEHGPSGELGEAHDEINLILPGANYGWPETVGDESMAGMQDPLLHTGNETWAPSGSEFYDGDMIPGWTGKYFVANLRGEHLRMVDLDLSNNGTPSHEGLFEGQFGRLRDVQTGPDGFLYLLTSNRDGRGSPVSNDDRIIKAVPVFDTAISRPANVLTYGLVDPPAGASIDPATGAFTWRPAEDQNGIHTVTVTVSDGHGGIDSQDVQVTVNGVNVAPTVDAGADQDAAEGSVVTLDATVTDLDTEDTLTYAWSHNSTLSITFTNDIEDPSFTAPNVSENTPVEFTLEASDGTTTVSDKVTVTIQDSANAPPTVDAGADFRVLDESEVTLNGTASDADGDTMTYSWIQTGGTPVVALTGSDTLMPTFTAPDVSSDADLTFQLTVGDGTDTVTDTVTVTVHDSAADFVTTWKTTSASEYVRILMGVHPGETIMIDWGDGSTSAMTFNGRASHKYSNPGEYKVAMTGGLARIYADYYSTPTHLASIDQWGDVRWSTMKSAFQYAINMEYEATDVPDLSGVSSMDSMFHSASKFNGDLSGWDVSSVTDLDKVFARASSFNGDVSTWDVSSVTSMNSMFHSAEAFNQPLNSWDVSSVTSMNGMFYNAEAFNSPLNSWDVSSVTSMSSMFHSAEAFNSPLNSWDVSSVTSMNGMFYNAEAFNSPLNSWDVTSVTSMSSMFYNAEAFNSPLNSWDVSSVTDMFSMFRDAAAFNSPLNSWDVTSVTDMNSMFYNAAAFNSPLNSWDVTSVTDMNSMFYNAAAFNSPLNSWDVSSVTDMFSMFRDAAAFNSPLNSWDVTSVTDMNSMFYNAAAFNSPLNSWDVTSVTDMNSMFYNAAAFNSPLNSWNVSSVAYMGNMFLSATAFDQNLGEWYVVPEDVSIARSDVTGMIGVISAQNRFLDDQSPEYAIGTGGDSDRFEIADGNNLHMTSVETKSEYDVNVTASGIGVFEDGNNWRMVGVMVSGQDNSILAVDAGADQDAAEGSVVTLDATVTDLDTEDTLTYAWSHNSTLSITFTNDIEDPSFTAPNVSEDTPVEFTLALSDGTDTVSDKVTVTIQDSANAPPTVDAGADQDAAEGSVVTLDATVTDLDTEDTLTYAWSHNSTLSITFTNDIEDPSFTAPNVSEDTPVEFTLALSDGTDTVSDKVTVTIQDSANAPPTVDAGADQDAAEGSVVTLDATVTDLDTEDTLTYAWSHNSTLSITFTNDIEDPSFTAPNVSEDTPVEFTLALSDGTDTVSDKVTVTIQDSANAPPTVDAGADQDAAEGSVVTLDATAADTDDDPLTYAWSHDSALAVQLANSTSPSTTFAAPQVNSDTTVTFTLTVNDGLANSTDTVLVTVSDVPDDSDFVTTWETTAPGESITIPARGTYTIDWGDGTVDAGVTGEQTHAYDVPGNHTVRISEGITGINLGNHADASKLRSIDQWGDAEWRSMYSAFRGASNMILHATDAPDLSSVKSTQYMFLNASSFDGDLSAWDVSHVTNMAGMFWEARSFNGDLSGWDVSSVTDMYTMFYNARSFDGNISAWNVSSVTNMGDMFHGASSFDGDLSAWDVSSVTDMFAMFVGASSFNGDLSGWNVSSVTDMADMFRGASSFNGDLSGWDITSATRMSTMFYEADAFDQNLGEWYIVLDDAVIDGSSVPGEVGRIAAQNRFLDGQNPVYGMGSGGDSAHFEIDGSILKMNSVPDGHAGPYSVTITSTGTYGSENSRTFEISVTDGADNTSSVAPSDPRGVGEITLTSTQSGTIQIDWDAPGEQPREYRVTWAKSGEEFPDWRDPVGNAFPISPGHTVTNLEEGEEYQVKVRARYDGSRPGDWSDIVTITVARTE